MVKIYNIIWEVVQVIDMPEIHVGNFYVLLLLLVLEKGLAAYITREEKDYNQEREASQRK